MAFNKRGLFIHEILSARIIFGGKSTLLVAKKKVAGSLPVGEPGITREPAIFFFVMTVCYY